MFNNLINNFKALDCLNAHISKDKTRVETIKEHTLNTIEVFEKINETYKIKDKFFKSFSTLIIESKSGITTLNKKEVNLLYSMFVGAIAFHDFGKINPAFQIDKMDKNIYELLNKKESLELKNNIISMDSWHSSSSSFIYINYFYKKISESGSKLKTFLIVQLLAYSNTILCHHGKLDNLTDNFSNGNFEGLVNKLTNLPYLLFYKGKINITNDVINGIKRILPSENSEGNILRFKYNTRVTYIWGRLLDSLLCASDSVATHYFFNKLEISKWQLNQIHNASELKNVFHNTGIYKGIEQYEKDANYFIKSGLPKINELRSDILLECKYNLNKKLDSRIFNIESPTGSGKTINSISCFLDLLTDNSNLFYVFPSNTLSSQTHEVLTDIFKHNLNIQEINSIAPLPLTKDNEVNYQKVLLDRQLLNYEAVITSNVSLFNIMFGTGRESSMSLFRLVDSVIILDEIQNYRNSIWKEIIELLYDFSDIMGFKLIIMSATLPNLEELVTNKSDRFVNLVTDPKIYYNNPLFKDRVKIDSSLLHTKIDFEKLKNNIIKATKYRNKIETARAGKETYSKVLIEFISKKTTQAFYDEMAGLFNGFEVYELDGDNSSFSRTKILEKIKEENPKKDILLIANQVIEAGIDIDMDLGFKDAAFPDVDEQFLGRINRSCKKNNCIAYFFYFDNEEKIYKDDFRIKTNITNQKYLDCLVNKTFKDVLYKDVISNLNYNKNKSIGSYMDTFNNVYLKTFENKTIYEKMRLILTETIEVFIIRTVNGVDGEEVWKDYSDLIKNADMQYAEKRIKTINIKQNINNFTFKMYANKINGIEPIGGYYLIPNGERFIKNDKLDVYEFQKIYDKKNNEYYYNTFFN